MRICLHCDGPIVAGSWRCGACGFAPTRVRGLPAFAADLAEENEGYDRGCFSDVVAVGEENFWRVTRRELILWALRRYVALAPGATWAEIGCGAGSLLAAVAEAFHEVATTGLDLYSESLEHARRRAPQSELLQADATRLPFREHFDALGAFDVIEHIEDDRAALAAMFGALVPGGALLLTVPQHPFLWSARDEWLRHKRRYRRAELVERVLEAGFEVVRVTSFMTLPLPAMAVSNWRNRRPRPGYHPFAPLRLGPLANRLLRTVLAVERTAIRAGLSPSLGGSLLLIARRPERPADSPL